MPADRPAVDPGAELDAAATAAEATRRVALFATCFNDVMWPQTPKAVVRLLRRLGCEVEFPVEQTCCGQMFTNTGYAAEAVPTVRTFVDTFSGYDAIVAPSGSCVGSVRHQHHDIAVRSKDARLCAEVDVLTPRVYELSEFLVDVLGVTDVGAYFPHSRHLPPDVSLAAHAAASVTARSNCCVAVRGIRPGWNCPPPRSAAGSAVRSP